MKMYLLEREYYGDFDILQTEPICVSSNKQTLQTKADNLNSMRCEEDIRNDVEYVVNPQVLPVI